MQFNGQTENKRLILKLRWVTIIVTSYIILFSKVNKLSSTFIILYILSNIFASRVPESFFVRSSFFYFLILFDTFMVSLGIYITSQFEADFYLVYFLIILFSAMARNFKVLIINAFIISGIYGWFLYKGGIDIEHLDQVILLRIPFIFIVNIFYGYLIHSYEDRMKRIRKDLNEVEESEKKYRQIVENSHDAVVLLDDKFGIEFFNNQLPQLTGYNYEELSGMDFRKLIKNSFLCGNDLNIVKDYKNYSFVEILRKDGLIRKVEINGSKFSIKENDSRIILFMKDRTEEEEMKERLIHSERLSAIGQLVSGVAHEINNPLTSIIGYGQLLLKEIKESRFKSEIKMIIDEALRASEIVRNLLTFARKYEPKMEMVDIKKLIEETLALKSYDLRVNNIEVVKDFDSELPEILMDPNKMKQVFLNIINNAEQAIKEIHRNGKLKINIRLFSNKVRIEFSDNGPGMPSENISKIFEPFFTTKTDGKGTGLGLSICYGIIKEHKGEIWAESEIGKGTSIFIEIPIRSVDVKKEKIKSEEEVYLDLKGKNILIIDDEPSIIDMLSKFFKLQQCSVETCLNGREALKKLIMEPFDFIICDIKMPGIDGIEFYRLLKEKGFSGLDRIIFITGDVINPNTEEFLNSIRNPYLIKPFDFDALKRILIGHTTFDKKDWVTPIQSARYE